MPNTHADRTIDVALIGGGIMSATLAVMLQRLQPDWHFQLFERLERPAAESSEAWNNAGTGHAGYCELNYTSEKPDGTIDISKALKINTQFELSKQFWAYLAQQGVLPDPKAFIRATPHISFVHGEEDVIFLKKRHEALVQNRMFRSMEFTTDPEVLRAWIPLMMEGRRDNEPMAATRVLLGTDVNFGNLTEQLLAYLDDQPNTDIFLHHEAVDLRRDDVSGDWVIHLEDLMEDVKRTVRARFVFIGAGGGALELLNDSDIPEADGYGGFPVSGQWLRCTNQEVINRHHAKVYGKAPVGSPPMSVPHLDTRIINGKKELLFGPFAGFSTKFLKRGSYFDLIRSIDSDNFIPLLQAGWDNVPLTRYLISQVLQSQEDRMEALREFYPEAHTEDWTLEVAGQRVQVIKDDEARGGVLEFGTEVVNAADGSLAALLGASPGASTAVAIILEVLDRCFPDHKEVWEPRLRAMLPFYKNETDMEDAEWERVTSSVNEVLGL